MVHLTLFEVKDIIEGKTVIASVMEEPADYGNHSY